VNKRKSRISFVVGGVIYGGLGGRELVSAGGGVGGVWRWGCGLRWAWGCRGGGGGGCGRGVLVGDLGGFGGTP